MADPPLNPWWTARYGLDTIEEFEAATDPLFDNLYVLDPTGSVKRVAQRQAAAFPGSAAGTTAAGYLEAKAFVDTPSWNPMQTVVAAVAAASQQDSGEAPLMAQLIIPDCFQVAILATSGGQVVANVIGLQNAGGTAQAAAAAVQTAWKIGAGPLTLLTTQYALTGFRAVDIGDPNGDIAVITDTTLGGVTAGHATNAASALVKWNGGSRSRSSRGRLYFGPLNEGNINPDGRTLVSGYITQANTAFTNFRNSLSASGYPLVVLSRVLSQAFPITQHAVESVIATQRRRIRD